MLVPTNSSESFGNAALVGTLDIGSSETHTYRIAMTAGKTYTFDDTYPAVTVSFGAATYTAAEGGAVRGMVTATLSADPERAVTIPLTAANQNGATAADYSGVPASVTFNAGQTSKTITFSATQDTLDDDGESVQLGFGSSLPAGVSEGSPSETTVSIRDDDDLAVTVSFGAATYTAAEGARPRCG